MRSVAALLLMGTFLAACCATPEPQGVSGSVGSFGFGKIGGEGMEWHSGLPALTQSRFWVIRELTLTSTAEYPVELPRLVGVIDGGNALEAWFEGIDRPLLVDDFVADTDWFIKRIYFDQPDNRAFVEIWQEQTPDCSRRFPADHAIPATPAKSYQIHPLRSRR